jgi:transcriptional regulator with XRE-family HTH domain
MRDIAKEVGLLIRKQRKLKGISQEGLAAKAQIDRSYMGRIERGEMNITLKVLWEISEAFEVSVKELIPD